MAKKKPDPKKPEPKGKLPKGAKANPFAKGGKGEDKPKAGKCPDCGKEYSKCKC